MSKIVRRMNRETVHGIRGYERLMNSRLPARELAHMAGKHRRWPLGLPVVARTPVGRLFGHVGKHWRSTEYPHACSVDFAVSVDIGDVNGARVSHVVPFRNLKPRKP